MLPQPAKLKLKSFLVRDDNGALDRDDVNLLSLSPPIADLFPHTTVLFADIVGFTAWSSEREPAQVFQLLVRV
jgi:class 3 adenylate cyclase